MTKIFAISLFFLSSFCFSEEQSFKQDILDGYNKRCQEVMIKKGYQEEDIDKVCACEVSILDNDFTTFKIVTMVVKDKIGLEPESQAKKKEIKEKIMQCKVQLKGN